MNLFQKYGIKEVANVTFYSIDKIGEEKFYTPALFFDTLKISDIKTSSETSIYRGGKTNKTLIAWDYNKDATIELKDALFTPASLDLICGGIFNLKLATYMKIIAKFTVAKKYFLNNYSVYAFKSPELTFEEWEIVYDICQNNSINSGSGAAIENKYLYGPNNSYVAQNRFYLRQIYSKRKAEFFDLVNDIIEYIAADINSNSKINKYDMSIKNLNVIDRYEICFVEKDTFYINNGKQKENLLKYYSNEQDNFNIYYDVKTMQPFFYYEENSETFDDNDSFCLKRGESYYKFSRTVVEEDLEKEYSLGKEIIIDTNTFPENVKIVGETYIRNKNTLKDERFQFIIEEAKIKTNSEINLSPDGEPTVFDMNITIVNPENEDLIKLIKYKVEKDIISGGFRIVPEKNKYSQTLINTNILEDIDVENKEIY